MRRYCKLLANSDHHTEAGQPNTDVMGMTARSRPRVRRASPLAVLLRALIATAFLLQGLVGQSHIHGLPPVPLAPIASASLRDSPVALAGTLLTKPDSAQSSDDGSNGLADDESCSLCRLAATMAACIAAAVLLGLGFALPERTAMPRRDATHRTAPSFHWLGRAPPR